MNYWMQFIDKDSKIIPTSSDVTFVGNTLDIPKLKERFNRDFVKNPGCRAVKIFFMGNGINKKFIAGMRDGKAVICAMDTKQEMNSKEFSEQLDILENILDPVSM